MQLDAVRVGIVAFNPSDVRAPLRSDGFMCLSAQFRTKRRFIWPLQLSKDHSHLGRLYLTL